MYLPHSALVHERSDVLRVDPAARENLDPAARLHDEPVDPAGTLGCRGRAARRQHALDAEPNQTLERGRQIVARIERAMERDGQWSRGRDEVDGP